MPFAFLRATFLFDFLHCLCTSTTYFLSLWVCLLLGSNSFQVSTSLIQKVHALENVSVGDTVRIGCIIFVLLGHRNDCAVG